MRRSRKPNMKTSSKCLANSKTNQNGVQKKRKFIKKSVCVQKEENITLQQQICKRKLNDDDDSFKKRLKARREKRRADLNAFETDFGNAMSQLERGEIPRTDLNDLMMRTEADFEADIQATMAEFRIGIEEALLEFTADWRTTLSRLRARIDRYRWLNSMGAPAA